MSKGFIEETKKVFKNNCPSPAKYWKLLQTGDDPNNIYHFCMKLFEAVIPNSKDQFLDDDHEAMYSTLMVLQFYKNTKAKQQKWLEQTQKIFEESQPKVFQHARWIIKLYLKNTEQHQFATNFISSTIHVPEKFSWLIEPGQQIEEALKEASDYQSTIEFKRKDKPFKKLSLLAFNDIIRESKIAAFSYSCFLDYLRSSNYQPKKKIWLHILDNLKGLIHSLRFTHKSEELVIIFLHLINNTLKFYGCAFEDMLKEMIYLVNILRNCPGHISDIAQILFETIHSELKFPGTTFRKEIKRRFVSIDYKRAEELGSKKYFISYRNAPFANPPFCTITNLRKLMIYNVLGCCKVDNIKQFWRVVQNLDPDTTFDLYYKVMKIIDIAGNLQTYESIQKLVRESLTQLFKLNWKPFRKLSPAEEEELKDMIIQDNPDKYFQFPNFEIVTIKPEELSEKQHRYSLYELVEENREHPYNEFFFSSFLEFVFMGNDEELSRILQIYSLYMLVDLKPKQFPNEYQKMGFYILPVNDSNCSLAQCLAYKDIWYKRYVFNIFRERLLYPYVSVQDPDIKDTFPMYLYTKAFHMYIREAQLKIPFMIFQCDLSLLDPEGKTETKNIFFLNHILIGASMEATIGKQEVKKQKKMTYIDGMEFYLQKIKKIPQIAVDMKVRYKEPGTDLLITKEEKFMTVEDIQICNTPKPYFFGYRPNPTNEFIELSILTSTSGKIFRNQLESKENFKRHSDLEIAEAFRDLFINLTADSIIIKRSEGSKQLLKLLIDGVEVSNIDELKIAPVFIEGLPLTFPVRCFLPHEA